MMLVRSGPSLKKCKSQPQWGMDAASHPLGYVGWKSPIARAHKAGGEAGASLTARGHGKIETLF